MTRTAKKHPTPYVFNTQKPKLFLIFLDSLMFSIYSVIKNIKKQTNFNWYLKVAIKTTSNQSEKLSIAFHNTRIDYVFHQILVSTSVMSWHFTSSIVIASFLLGMKFSLNLIFMFRKTDSNFLCILIHVCYFITRYIHRFPIVIIVMMWFLKSQNLNFFLKVSKK